MARIDTLKQQRYIISTMSPPRSGIIAYPEYLLVAGAGAGILLMVLISLLATIHVDGAGRMQGRRSHGQWAVIPDLHRLFEAIRQRNHLIILIDPCSCVLFLAIDIIEKFGASLAPNSPLQVLSKGTHPMSTHVLRAKHFSGDVPAPWVGLPPHPKRDRRASKPRLLLAHIHLDGPACAMKAQMRTRLVTDAPIKAIWRRGTPDSLLHHSVQGSQHTGEPFQRQMVDHGITCSMSRPGDVWDNAAMESFF